MALHTPTQHAGIAGHVILRDILVAFGLAAALLIVMALAMTVTVTIDGANPMSAEQQSLIEHRAGERTGR
jgi:hypothetical protein